MLQAVNVDPGIALRLAPSRPAHACDLECRHFQLHNEDGWCAWGVCLRDGSARREFPVLVRRECPAYETPDG